MSEWAKTVGAHIRYADEPLDAMTNAMVRAIEGWKLNDETAIDEAIKIGLDRIAKSVEEILENGH